MKADAILSLYEHHTRQWLSELETFPAAHFHISANGGWSMAQVIDHVCKTTHTCVALALQCAEGKGETGHSGFGPAVFGMMGGFPPVRIRVKTIPAGVEHVYHPENISAAQAKEELEKALAAMRDALATVKTADPKVRIKHWAGGWFNGVQWYHNAEMHLKHHFRQLKRIKKAVLN